jgi:hypothetical protein
MNGRERPTTPTTRRPLQESLSRLPEATFPNARRGSCYFSGPVPQGRSRPLRRSARAGPSSASLSPVAEGWSPPRSRVFSTSAATTPAERSRSSSTRRSTRPTSQTMALGLPAAGREPTTISAAAATSCWSASSPQRPRWRPSPARFTSIELVARTDDGGPALNDGWVHAVSRRRCTMKVRLSILAALCAAGVAGFDQLPPEAGAQVRILLGGR